MKIDSFSIENFKSLRDVNLELENLTLLTGINSSGKSSFIQALLLFKQNWASFPMAKFDIKPLSINGDLVKLGNKQDLLFQEAYDEDIKLTLKNDSSDVYIEFNTSNLKYTTNYNIASFLKYKFNLTDNFQYIQTNRVEPEIFYPFSEEIINEHNIGTRGEYTAHYLAENRHQSLRITELKHPLSTTNHLLENVSCWLSEISKGIEVSSKIYTELQRVNLTYKYVYKDTTTNDYSPLNVGFGLTFVLPIIVAILKAKPDDLIIIENPESHLHASGQSKIAELCSIASQNGVQLIIETHSDHFLNSLRVSVKEKVIEAKNIKVYYFRKEINELESKVDNITIDEYGNIDSYPKGFFDEWDINLDKLLGL